MARLHVLLELQYRFFLYNFSRACFDEASKLKLLDVDRVIGSFNHNSSMFFSSESRLHTISALLASLELALHFQEQLFHFYKKDAAFQFVAGSFKTHLESIILCKLAVLQDASPCLLQHCTSTVILSSQLNVTISCFL